MKSEQFLPSRSAITESIQRVISNQSSSAPLLMLVAYWGLGSAALLQRDKAYKIVCNLTDGGTNPEAIEAIMMHQDISVELRHHPRLHAKVVLGQGGAVVSSANCSSNGLALNERPGNIEAGTFFPTGSLQISDINQWAWALWTEAEDINIQTLEQAKLAYVRNMASLNSVCDNLESGVASKIDSPLPKLREEDLFAPEEHSSKDALRTGSALLLRCYKEMRDGEQSPRDGWICAYVANLLWTYLGHSMTWRDGVFNFPHQVVVRWRDKNVKDDEIVQFLSWLSVPGNAPNNLQKISEQLLMVSWHEFTK